MDDSIKKIQSLLDRGYGWKDIGAELGVAPSTAHRWYHKAVPKQRPHQEKIHHNHADILGREFQYKKDFVRYYLDTHNTSATINLDELYHLATMYFNDWKKADKEDVLRWIKQYMHQIGAATSKQGFHDETTRSIKNGTSSELCDGKNSTPPSLKTGRKPKNEKVKHIGNKILDYARQTIEQESGNDPGGQFAVNRWVYQRLAIDERKDKGWIKQTIWESRAQICRCCKSKFDSLKGLHLHRKDDSAGYSLDNCELLHKECHERLSSRNK